jgi:hypothetical protein
MRCRDSCQAWFTIARKPGVAPYGRIAEGDIWASRNTELTPWGLFGGTDRVGGHRAAVGGAAQRHGGHAVLLATLDRQLVGSERRELAQAIVTVHDDLASMVLDDFQVRMGADPAGLQPGDVGRHPDHAMRVDASGIGLD